MYHVNDVTKGYSYYRRLLMSKCLELFVYEGLPESLPAVEIEYRLNRYGQCVVFDHPKYGVVTATGGVSNIDIYNHPTEFVYAQPVLSRTDNKTRRTIGEDCSVIYSNFVDSWQGSGTGTTYTTICRYAQLLADVDSSVQITTVNTRQTSILTAKNGKDKAELEKMIASLKRGVLAIVKGSNTGAFESVSTLPFSADGDKTLASLCSTRRDILANFYEEIGVSHKRDKVAEMTAREVGEANETLTLNQESLLAGRRRGVKMMNEMFGLNVTVEFNPTIKEVALNEVERISIDESITE